MNIKLVPALEDEIEQIWKMQIEAFSDLLEKYRDFDTSPGNEGIEKIKTCFHLPGNTYYFIYADGLLVGVIRIIDHKDGVRKKKISPIFIMKEYRSRGYAHAAILEAERIHGKDGWMLDTILQEEGNCHLYEKLGYKKTGRTKEIKDNMTIVFYEK